MADITMCNGVNCELKDTCYRHKATPSNWQSYFSIPPFTDGKSCEYYWNDKEHHKSDFRF